VEPAQRVSKDLTQIIEGKGDNGDGMGEVGEGEGEKGGCVPEMRDGLDFHEWAVAMGSRSFGRHVMRHFEERIHWFISQRGGENTM